jgi:hypothetical protein
VAIPHPAVFGAALLALLCLPCAVALLLCADQIALRRSWSRRDPHALTLLRRLDLVLGRTEADTARDDAEPLGAGPAPAHAAPPPPDGPMPCLDQITAELRRLGRQRRRGPATESAVWRAAVLYAYDEWLRLACRTLGVAERLEPLEGMDRELERVRVEDALRANGMTFR